MFGSTGGFREVSLNGQFVAVVATTVVIAAISLTSVYVVRRGRRR